MKLDVAIIFDIENACNVGRTTARYCKYYERRDLR